jgi:hypothetical protein
MATIDPLRDGPRNDHMQDLQNKYTRICKEEGLAARPQIVQVLQNLDERNIQVPLEQITWFVVDLSHKVAANQLESPEFRPLVRWWVNKFPSAQQEMSASRLEDLGALTYQRAIREGP